MISKENIDKAESEFQKEFCRNSHSKYVSFGCSTVVLDDVFTLEELEFIVSLMKKYDDGN